MVHVASSASRSKTPPVPAAHAANAARTSSLFACSADRTASLMAHLRRATAGAGTLQAPHAVQLPHEVGDGRGRLLQRSGIERRLRVVLDPELHALGVLVAGDAGDERETHVDARRDAGRGDDLAL